MGADNTEGGVWSDPPTPTPGVIWLIAAAEHGIVRQTFVEVRSRLLCISEEVLCHNGVKLFFLIVWVPMATTNFDLWVWGGMGYSL